MMDVFLWNEGMKDPGVWRALQPEPLGAPLLFMDGLQSPSPGRRLSWGSTSQQLPARGLLCFSRGKEDLGTLGIPGIQADSPGLHLAWKLALSGLVCFDRSWIQLMLTVLEHPGLATGVVACCFPARTTHVVGPTQSWDESIVRTQSKGMHPPTGTLYTN